MQLRRSTASATWFHRVALDMFLFEDRTLGESLNEHTMGGKERQATYSRTAQDPYSKTVPAAIHDGQMSNVACLILIGAVIYIPAHGDLAKIPARLYHWMSASFLMPVLFFLPGLSLLTPCLPPIGIGSATRKSFPSHQSTNNHG